MLYLRTRNCEYLCKYIHLYSIYVFVQGGEWCICSCGENCGESLTVNLHSTTVHKGPEHAEIPLPYNTGISRKTIAHLKDFEHSCVVSVRLTKGNYIFPVCVDLQQLLNVILFFSLSNASSDRMLDRLFLLFDVPGARCLVEIWECSSTCVI